MTPLAWTESLQLNHAVMDKTHEEFVALLADTHAACQHGLHPQALEAFERLLAHTANHFAQEDRWMQATGFAPENCHTRQHEMVLHAMREAARLARDDANREPLRILLGELGQWFAHHVAMMDASLAAHLQAVGFRLGAECQCHARTA